MEQILIVDDEDDVRATLAAILKAEGYGLRLAKDSATAREILERGSVDIVLLDIRMPGEDGLAFCRWLQGWSRVPVVFISGLAEDIDRVVGLELGADDYIVKPFNRRELLARVRAVLRRARPHPPSPQAAAPGNFRRFAGWRLDLDRRWLVSPDGTPVPLTRGEFEMMEVLSSRPGRALSRDQILDLMPRKGEPPTDRTVDVMVRRLRKKMEVDPDNPRIIVTVYGVGYIFAPEVAPD